MITLYQLVVSQCCNLVDKVCLGMGLFGDRFRRDGECWVKQQKPCQFFAKYVLPLNPELVDDYIQTTGDTDVGDIKPNYCECGTIIEKGKVKCKECKV